VEPQALTLTKGSDAEIRMKRFLRENITSIRDGLHELHTQKIVKWRKAYEAVPAEEVREFPWHGASNLVVPLIAIHTDTLLARVMSAVIKTQPFWVARVLGNADGLPKEMRTSLEIFLNYVGLEPSELDLYRVYHEFFCEIIKLGTSVLKMPWFKDIEDKFMPAGDMSGKYDFEKVTVYEGPRPEKLSFQNFGIQPAMKTIHKAKFKYDKIPLTKYDLEERAYRRIYDRVAVQEVIKQPDRMNPDFVQNQEESDLGVRTVPTYGWSEYDIYECHFQYRLEGDHYCRLIVWYHEKSDQILRAFHFYYPDEIFLAGRLFYRDGLFHGYGFAETLASLQEEVSQIHNQRRDNMTIANMKAFRADPTSKLHEGFKIFSSAVVPGKKDEIEALDMGTPVQGEIDSERLTLELAEKRSGVSPPMQGSGAGSNTKRGVYTAMGTLSLLQEGNTRTDLNITDVRFAHTLLGRMVCRQYGAFGPDSEFHKDRVKMFGRMAPAISQALDMLYRGKLALPVYASTSSVNREVEKQNDLMLAGIMARHYQMITQMIQGANSQNPMQPTDPVVKKYLMDSIGSADLLMKYILRHFGYDEVDTLVPEPQLQAMPPTPPQMTGGMGPMPMLGGGGGQGQGPGESAGGLANPGDETPLPVPLMPQNARTQ
jgi:hypothetical protein